jgi:hypothetical protein
LPNDLNGFTRDLYSFFAHHQPFAFELTGVHVTDNGLVIVDVNTIEQQLASSLKQKLACSLKKYPELDQPKHPKGLHVTIGYFNTGQPFAMDEERARFETAVAQLTNVPVGEMVVQQVWLVHYANRTLDRIVGKVPFTLGQTNALTAERLLRELGVAPSHPPNEPAPPPSGQ